MTTAKDILDLIKEKEVKYVDARFTDVRGKMQHVTFDIDLVDDEFLTDGTMFDGSSISGWKAINESDMKLRPDLSTAIIDPFYQQTTMALFCDVLNPDTNTPYERDPRSIASAALAYAKSAGVGDTVYFGPEAEFFIFDDVRWSTAPHDTSYSYDSTELPVNSAKAYEEGNMGHRPGPKGG
ncbi:MAG TPA: glutamine synthetase beta-grasp domain-containing protein, partial [Caulobacteraceae bacterium]